MRIFGDAYIHLTPVGLSGRNDRESGFLHCRGLVKLVKAS